MLKTERKQLILEELNQHNVVSLEKLVSLLETSESTVRRDLDELEAENKLRRVHGGAFPSLALPSSFRHPNYHHCGLHCPIYVIKKDLSSELRPFLFYG